MDYPEYLFPVLSRFVGEFPRLIDCGRGWWPLISALDLELSEVDPDYTLYQIKEKFGGLRYYYAPSSPHKAQDLSKIITRYEERCWGTCEVTGQSGILMIRHGCFKTLHESFAGSNGWEIAESL